MKRLIALVICVICASSVAAQPVKRVAVRVGAISASQECTVYEGVRASSETSVAGTAGGYANAYGAGGHMAYSASSRSSFETYFVKDCVSHFEGMRTAIQSALASSGSVIVASGGYLLSGRVESVVPISSGYAEQSINGQNFGSASNGLKVTMSVNLADRAGRLVFGAVIVTQIPTDSVGFSRGTVDANLSSGEGQYGLLQRQVSLAVARQVAFHFNPLVVSQSNGSKIQLNYGMPLLEVGSTLSVTSLDGRSAALYHVTSVTDGSALAQQLGGADSAGIIAGSRARVVEDGDAAANQTQEDKVELP